MNTVTPMQAILTQLLEKHGVALTAPTTFLWLALPGRAERLVIERLDLHYLSVALAHVAPAGAFRQDPQLCFATAATGWTPIHGEGIAAVGDLTGFAEAWAQRLQAEGWLERSEPLPEPRWAVTSEMTFFLEEQVRHNLEDERGQPPTWATLMDWLGEDGGCETTDGCWVEERDGVCEHGHSSWLVALGLL